jgi:hypothetical protein
MKVYMIQGVGFTPLYKVSDDHIVRCHPVTIIPKAFLTQRQAIAYRIKVMKEHIIDCPIVIEVTIEPIDE